MAAGGDQHIQQQKRPLPLLWKRLEIENSCMGLFFVNVLDKRMIVNDKKQERCKHSDCTFPETVNKSDLFL
jgi:hypothetical protein